MDNLKGRPFCATGMRVTERSADAEISPSNGTSLLDKNAKPILPGIKLGVAPKEKVIAKTFAPVPKPIAPVEEKHEGTTILTPLKKLS